MTTARWRVLLAAVLVSGTMLPGASLAKDDLSLWNARIQETVQLLRAGNAAQARATIGPVLEEMTNEVNPGKNATHAFGLALMLRALAEAGSGNERLAIWDWHIAQQIDATMERWDLREFGAAGEVLAHHRLSSDPVPVAPTSKELEKAGGQAAVMLQRGRQPTYVEKSRLRRWMGSIVLAALIDREGLPGYPRIVRGSDEVAIVVATCEYARGLEFTPASLEGKPIAAIWDLTVNYRLE
ncbi:MAG: energy transducer TonB [Thermoanaerobaculia bacterium]